MSDLLNAAALDQLFRTARTQNAFLDTPVSEDLLRELYDLVKWGPTAANGSPARFVFVTTAEGKEKLKPALSEGNAAKTLAAPVTAIIGFDEDFHEKLPYLFPACRCQELVRRPAHGAHRVGIPQQLAAGRVPDPGRACAGPGCRPDVRLRQCQGGCCVLCRHAD